MQSLVQYYNCTVGYLDNEHKHLVEHYEHYSMFHIQQNILICTHVYNFIKLCQVISKQLCQIRTNV